MIELFDTHAHLSDEAFAVDREAVLDRAAAAGVSRIVEIADEPKGWPNAIALCRARPAQVRCSLGLHPYYASEFTSALLDSLAEKIKLPEVVAVGEIGLDYVKTDTPPQTQKTVLSRLLEACLSWDKPAVIHCRGAYPDLREVLKPLYLKPPIHARFWGVIHCFSGTVEDALFLSKLGFALGVDGPVTYPKNNDLREALRQAGISCLVLETDSPYLPPQSNRGKRNEPSAIAEIAAKIEQTLDLPLEEVTQKTTANALALYRSPLK